MYSSSSSGQVSSGECSESCREAHVGAAILHVALPALAVVFTVQDPHVELGMKAAQRGQDRRQDMHAEAAVGGDLERAGQGGHLVDGQQQVARRAEGAPGMFQGAFARLGELNARRGAAQQGPPQDPLQTLHALAEAALRHVQVGGRRAETAGFCDSDKNAKLGQRQAGRHTAV